jgi:hypothetical protein
MTLWRKGSSSRILGTSWVLLSKRYLRSQMGECYSRQVIRALNLEGAQGRLRITRRLVSVRMDVTFRWLKSLKP